MREAEKSLDLQPASLRHRRADDVVWVQTPVGTRLRKNRCFSSSPKAGKTSILAHDRQEDIPSHLLGRQPFYIRAFIRLSEACSQRAIQQAHPHSQPPNERAFLWPHLKIYMSNQVSLDIREKAAARERMSKLNRETNRTTNNSENRGWLLKNPFVYSEITEK